VDNCRKIPISLIDSEKGERKAHACANAWLQQLTSMAYAAPEGLFRLKVRRWVADCTIFGMKPRGLGATTAAMAVLNLGGFVGIDWTRRGVVVMVASVVLLGYVVLWYYWQGRNWARQFVMFTSIMTIVGFLGLLVVTVLLLVTEREYRLYVQDRAAVAIANAALGAFLLYWLNKKDVRNWFRKSEPSREVL
jgi:hypothetical protein